MKTKKQKTNWDRIWAIVHSTYERVCYLNDQLYKPVLGNLVSITNIDETGLMIFSFNEFHDDFCCCFSMEAINKGTIEGNTLTIGEDVIDFYSLKGCKL